MSNLREPQSTSLRLFYPPPVISRSLRSYEHGVNTFDTANIYSNGVSEVYLGRAIKALDLPRDEIVVMTKVCGPPGLGNHVESQDLKHRTVVRGCR
jgi:aryl-alcohol dehydrogenase-like predicted oxidoreductase